MGYYVFIYFVFRYYFFSNGIISASMSTFLLFESIHVYSLVLSLKILILAHSSVGASASSQNAGNENAFYFLICMTDSNSSAEESMCNEATCYDDEKRSVQFRLVEQIKGRLWWFSRRRAPLTYLPSHFQQ